MPIFTQPAVNKIARYFVHDVTIIRPTVSDGRYGPELDLDDIVETTVKGWVTGRFPADLALASQDESSHRELSASYFEAFLPPDTDLRPTDRVRVHGFLCDVLNEPRQGFTPYGTVSHLEALLKAVTG
jgi:hypothetical protein